VAVYALLAAALIGYSMLTPETRTVAHGVSQDQKARAEACLQQTASLFDAADRQMPGQVAAQDGNQYTKDRPRSCRSSSSCRPNSQSKRTEGRLAPQLYPAETCKTSLSIGQRAQTPVRVRSAKFFGLLIPGPCLADVGVNTAHSQPRQHDW